jgi:signal transduction histidine kinase
VLARDIARRAASAVENSRLYREAKDALAARDDFLFLAAHELRTPVTALALKLERAVRRLRKDATADPEPARDVAAALQQTERLTKLINALLDVTGIASRRLALRHETIDLSELISDVCNQLRPAAAQASCDLRHQAPGEPVVGSWDRAAIERVIVNLVSNAIKFGAGRPIDMASRCEGGFAEFSVSDHGVGIASEDLTRIFGRFERAVPAHRYAGLGLGLYISKGLVEAHGGSIEVRSRPGEGACFTVKLPQTVGGRDR